ncbi:MAG: transglutaminase family protein [Deltaproteobacteria bacterium]|nr:transglutaminase family protein [Deltaproteobacteria bacterium]
MAVDVSLHHETRYHYDRRVKLGPQVIRLRPAPHTRSSICRYSLSIEPQKHFINWQQDPFGNYLARVVFSDPTDHLYITVGLVTEIRSFNPFDFFLDKNYESFPFSYSEELSDQLKPYLKIIDSGPLITSLAEGIDRSESKIVDFLVKINRDVCSKLNYLVRLEPGVQSSDVTLSKQSGSCRDFAWLLCQILRHLGLATRFVSGYLIQLKPDIRSASGPGGPEEDFTDLHAWTEVYLPGAGWVGLDATSGLLAGEGHIPLCCTPFPQDAAPLSGELEACHARLDHMMSVTRLNQDRRITKPYSEEEWQDIDKLGRVIDDGLRQEDVRLTMGGEPTFVPADNIESESWVGKASGGGKWDCALKLTQRLRDHLYPGSLVHLGQGKWYPGESLPRWAISTYYRSDGKPIFETELCTPVRTSVKTYCIENAKDFIESLAKTLSLSDDFILSALEKDGHVAAYVLPLLYSHTLSRWISSRWKSLTHYMELTEGDSPAGYRLPLHQVPVNQAGQNEIWPYRDPAGAVEPFKERAEILQQLLRQGTIDLPDSVMADAYVRTALCVEIRNGHLSVFCPPLSYAEHFLELMIAIELVAKELSYHVRIEGYQPPADRRLQSFSVTPDPGVLEVNISPVANWNDYQNSLQTIYKEAHLANLSSSRFFVDGRRVGTGGGNHIVLGAQKPEDSPFLRRPDLLQSLLTFWQHHPSLSYLFSSEFIGPTSQSPRIDESRNDSLYELEIAFRHLEKNKETAPWLVDRLFRNLLIDSSGNTHRSEFCIDKLFSPDSATGRLGLVEMRGFEMPPHPQMALVQGLLVRAVVLLFWKHPYQHRLIRWGSRLHDEFMLPDRLWGDFCKVLNYLEKFSIKFDPAWFQAFFDFRCPLWGRTQVGHMELELRHALEPWHVMGEDLYHGTVSRAVDSSVERIQIRMKGYDERFDLACNGFRIPLQRIQDASDYIAGIRYKAWQPPSGLHPTLPVNTPLIFDVVEKSSGHSIGGCTFYSAHPGGRSYETVPVNENEAESRCRAKFSPLGFTVGKVQVRDMPGSEEFRYTLDLRCS